MVGSVNIEFDLVGEHRLEFEGFSIAFRDRDLRLADQFGSFAEEGIIDNVAVRGVYTLCKKSQRQFFAVDFKSLYVYAFGVFFGRQRQTEHFVIRAECSKPYFG